MIEDSIIRLWSEEETKTHIMDRIENLSQKQLTFLSLKFESIGKYLIEHHMKDLSYISLQIIGVENPSLGKLIIDSPQIGDIIANMPKLNTGTFISSLASADDSVARVVLEKYDRELHRDDLTHIAVNRANLRTEIIASHPDIGQAVQERLDIRAYSTGTAELSHHNLDLSDLAGVSSLFDLLDSDVLS